ncbi:hypothetical protein CAPTEDRAFT_138817 [Capitella teleta]|uniref:RING-type domain-containing protein n=1 Tax=Capitella teleta TaxID=283909 RepID=R7VGW5_CAPTE|nr:hypothetical protein CAPTEDRAFT_138817 [Capitella teleta]|eukprot:ELU14935.1 hypothetical protein CAPTEDRAFT_138817 [Capitella teleta]
MLLKTTLPPDAPLFTRLCSSDVLIVVCFLHQTLISHSSILLYSLLLVNELRLLTASHRVISQHLVFALVTTKRLVTLNVNFNFLKAQWARLRVVHVHSAFWALRVTFVLFVQLSQSPWQEGMKQVLSSSCETVVMLFGMACVISHITHLLHRAIAAFLCLETDTEAGSMGATSGVLFFILALQTGLLGMGPEQKLSRLYRNCCLLLTAVLHFTHGLVHPPLMSLSASHSSSLHRHSRALLVAMVLLVIPSVWLRWLWAQHSVSTWLLAMTAFSVEIIIKTLVSLLIYGLFMLDAYLSTFWESLDDYVYCIQAAGSSFEFICGIFLFCNGAWIVVFESGGVIRAVMMAIHAYFNIFMQAKKGWRTFVLRRTAVRKINLLPQATAEQLREHDDVCAICFQELTSACMTSCKHLFHGVCLRKWLYIRDECPMCHHAIFAQQ